MPGKVKKHIAITGASSGIGAALAEYYAGFGYRLALCARNMQRLEQIASECKALGATVSITEVEISNLSDVKLWISSLNEVQPIDIMFVNAGVTGGVGAGKPLETSEDVGQILSTNLIGATNTINEAVEMMLVSGGGQIVITNSLASYVGFQGSPAYCASKAGLKIYCESLQRLLKPKNILFTLIYPGYVDSPMSRKVVGSKPLTKSAENAARLIALATEKKKPQMGFPYSMWMGVRLLSILPFSIQNIFVPLFDWQMDIEPEKNVVSNKQH